MSVTTCKINLIGLAGNLVAVVVVCRLVNWSMNGILDWQPVHLKMLATPPTRPPTILPAAWPTPATVAPRPIPTYSITPTCL